MPTTVTCSNAECGASFEVPDEQAGGIVLCPECGTAIQTGAAADQAEGAEEEDLSSLKHHPARQRCPNCNELLGVRDAICRHCGADIRTGAVAEAVAARKKSKLVPILVGGGILVALAVLAGLIFVAVRLLSDDGEAVVADAEPAEQPAQAAGDAGQPAPPPPPGGGRTVADPEQAPEPQFEIAEGDLGDLAMREQQTEDAVREYEERLRGVLGEIRAATADEMADHWADLYEFCLDAGLDAEAEQCWSCAVALRPTNSQVNAKLGRTESYAGIPVTPEQKRFLEGLAPVVTFVNRDPALQNHTVSVVGAGEAPLSWDAPARLAAPAGRARVEVKPQPGTEGPTEAFEMDLRNGLQYTVTLRPALGAPDVGFQAMADIYQAVTAGERVEGVSVQRDWQEAVLSATKGDVQVVRNEGGSLAMQLGRNGEVLSITGTVMAGNPYLHGGQIVLSGLEDKPLRLLVDGRSETVSLRAGICYELEIDLADGLWGILGTAQGDLASEWARRRLVAQADEVAFLGTEREAEGEFLAPWQTTEYAYGQMKAFLDTVERDLSVQDRAADRAEHIDRVRALGLEDRLGYLYLNWPRYRDALAALSQDSYGAIMEQVALLRPVRSSTSRGRGRMGMATAMGGPSGRGRPQPPRTEEEEETDGGPTPRRERDRLPYDPPDLTLQSSQRREVLMSIVPVLPDHIAIQQIEENWLRLDESARKAAFASLEKIGTREAISFLGRLSEEAGQQDVVVLSLLALGEIGTREALIYLDAPAFAEEVKMASLAARACAGDPRTLEELPELLSELDEPVRNLFLSFVTSMDTPAAVLVLSQAIDIYTDSGARQSIAEALARLGGHAAARQLARLMEASGDVYSDLLPSISADEGLLLLRNVGRAVGEGKGGAEAVAFLTDMEDEAAYAFLRAAAAGRGGPDVIYELVREGSGTALRAAVDTVGSVNVGLLRKVRDDWYSYDSRSGTHDWQGQVDPEAAAEFLQAVLARNAEPKVGLTAARMLTEIDRAPSVGALVALAEAPRQAQAAPPVDRRGGGPRGGGRRGGPSMGPPAGISFGPTIGRTAREYELDGFEWPDGEPELPDDFELTGRRQFYALGLLQRTGGPEVATAVRDLLTAYDGADLRAAAMEVLATIGREEDLELLRSLAVERKGSYADKPALAREMQDRLAALGAIGTAKDASFLPRILDIMAEEPPAAAAVGGLEQDEYEELAGWFQLTLRRGACENLMRTCRDQQLSELVTDRNLQNEMVRRLVRLIEEPGPDLESLGELNRTVRARAVAAFGRCADYYEEETRLVLKRLALTVGGGRREPQRGPRRARGGRASRPEEGPSMESALKDAVVHMAVRGGGLTLLNEMSSLLPTSGEEDTAWTGLMVRLATAPTPEYFSVLNMVFDSLDPAALWSIYEKTRGKADTYDIAYARYLAKMVRGPGNPELTQAPPTRQRGPQTFGPPPGVGGPPTGPGGPPRGIQTGPPPEVLERIEAIRESGPGAGRITAPIGARGGGRRRSTTVRSVDRTVARRQKRWSYSISDLLAEVEVAKDRWQVIQVLFKSSAGAVAAAVESEGLLNHPQFGPAIAAMYVERTPGARENAVGKLRAILTGQAESIDRSASELDLQRSAAAALRRLGGEDAAEALYDGLVGPEQERARTGAAPGMGPPPGVMGPTGPVGPMGPRGPMASRGDRRPSAPYVARALGTMGEAELLRAALNATGRRFFSSSAVAVQTAALEGMAFMPADAEPLKVLQELLKLANTKVLKEAAADAIAIALRRKAV